MTTQNESNFKILSPREQILLRPGTFIGSVDPEEIETWSMGKRKVVKYTPGLIKIVNEVLDNSVDEAIRTNYEYATEICVTIDENTITISDNGRGLPQHDVKTPEGDLIPVPVAAWTRPNSGSNFDDSVRTGIGMNGVGSFLTNLFSLKFVGETCDGEHVMTVTCGRNAERITHRRRKATKADKQGTTVTFLPDFTRFDVYGWSPELTEIILGRLSSLAVTHPEITFKLNKKKVPAGTIKTYATMFHEKAIYEQHKSVSFFVAPAGEGVTEFKQTSFVNGVETTDGGSHVDYFMKRLCDELIPKIKTKFKLDVTTTAIKNGMTVGLFLRGFLNPRFTSQTKEKLSNKQSEISPYFADGVNFKKLADKIIKTPEIIDPINDTFIAKKDAAEARAAQAEQNKSNKRRNVEGHIPSNKGGMLFLLEGKSARGPFRKVRDRDTQGAFPLRGKPMNTYGVKPSKILANEELNNIIGILGLDIVEPESIFEPDGKWFRIGDADHGDICNENDEVITGGTWKPITRIPKLFVIPESEITNIDRTKYTKRIDIRRKTTLRYDEIGILADPDPDGMGDIAPLLIQFFSRWKRLIDDGRLRIVKSPILILSKKGKEDIWLFSQSDYDNVKYKGWDVRYIKGLGSLTEAEYRRMIREPVVEVVRLDDPRLLTLLFSKKSVKDRQQWVQQNGSLDGIIK
ncbi:DNA topoisomerase II large subunit [Vibrio phage EniLVp02]